MTPDTEEIPTIPAAPAPLGAALRDRLLAAMNGAADEERAERRIEAMLQRLSPAPLPARLAGQLGAQMCYRAVEERGYRPQPAYRRLPWAHYAAAASLALLLGAGGFSLFLGNATADTKEGMMSRIVIESRSEDDVQWKDDEPLRSYEVIYEDNFVMDADDDMKVMVRVPNRATVRVPEEML